MDNNLVKYTWMRIGKHTSLPEAPLYVALWGLPGRPCVYWVPRKGSKKAHQKRGFEPHAYKCFDSRAALGYTVPIFFERLQCKQRTSDGMLA